MKKITTIVSSVLALSLPALAFAQINPPQGIRSFGGFLNVFDTFISWIFTILLVLSIIMIIFAAFQYLTAGGDEEAVKKANKKIVFAVIAIAVAFLAQGISFVVGELLNTGGAGVSL